MPRYSYSLENGAPVASEDATEAFAHNQAAMDHAKLIAKDLARSQAARDHLRVVVRNEAGDEIGNVALQVELTNGAPFRMSKRAKTRKTDKHDEYVRYAEQCLAMAKLAPDQESRAIQREMAAEWLRLAEKE